MAIDAPVALLFAVVLTTAGASVTDDVCGPEGCRADGQNVSQEEAEEMGLLQFKESLPGVNASMVQALKGCGYWVISFGGVDYCMTATSVVANAKVYSNVACNGATNQQWTPDYGYYTGGKSKIKSCANSNLCLDVWYGNQNLGTNGPWDMDIYDCMMTTNSAENQAWTIQWPYLKWTPSTTYNQYYATSKSNGPMQAMSYNYQNQANAQQWKSWYR